MPAFFKAAGYRTCNVGKLDSVKAGSRGPADLGWERWLGGGYEHRDPMVASSEGNRRMQGWTADLWTDEALTFIRTHRDAPWFASVAMPCGQPAPPCCRRRSLDRRQAAYSAGGAVISGSILPARTSGAQARCTRTWRPPVPASQWVRPASSTTTLPPRSSRQSSGSGPLTA